MKTSQMQVQRAISAALRKLNTDATFLADARITSAQATNDQTVDRRSCYLRETIELILGEFEKEEEGNEDVIADRP
jgi:hypothetical protein